LRSAACRRAARIMASVAAIKVDMHGRRLVSEQFLDAAQVLMQCEGPSSSRVPKIFSTPQRRTKSYHSSFRKNERGKESDNCAHVPLESSFSMGAYDP
jgi:hypothetical protein